MNRKLIYSLAGALFFLQLLSGCGGEEFTYVPNQEIKPGPGLFSGESGEFTLLGPSIPEEDKTEGLDLSSKKKP